MLKFFIVTSILFFNCFNINSQVLKKGFDPNEFKELMHISAQFGGESYRAELPVSDNYQFLYRSAAIGLGNCWDLYLRDDKVAVLSIRGTTENNISWLANFYSAMVPAKGKIEVSKTKTFNYNLADSPSAAVHVGWLLSSLYLYEDMKPKIDSLSKTGIKEFLIIGHSQGGAITYMLNAMIYQKQKYGLLDDDLIFKTYCSAAPKPGNINFAYEYESNFYGMAYHVVNAEDWVPEFPVTIQTLHELNKLSPFTNMGKTINAQKFPVKFMMKRIYKKMDKPTKKALKNYQKYMGDLAYKMIKKTIPEFKQPEYYKSNNYVRTGETIVLIPDSEYFNKFPQNAENIWTNHFHAPYLYLIEKSQYKSMNNTASNNNIYNIKWNLVFLDGYTKEIPKETTPFILIGENGKSISGNSGCNLFNGKVKFENGEMSLSSNLAMTKMYCGDSPEDVFMEKLHSCNEYFLSENNELVLAKDNKILMRFVKVD